MRGDIGSDKSPARRPAVAAGTLGGQAPIIRGRDQPSPAHGTACTFKPRRNLWVLGLKAPCALCRNGALIRPSPGPPVFTGFSRHFAHRSAQNYAPQTIPRSLHDPCHRPPRRAASAEPAAPAANPADVWDLTLLYKDDAAWHAAKDHLAAEIPKIKSYQGRLGESAATLQEAMDLIYGLRKDYDRLAVYSSLKRDVNTRDTAALELNQEADLLGTDFSRAVSFVNPELLAVGETKLRAFLDADPGLAQYRFPIMEVLRAAPHTLGAEAEGVLSAANLITDTPMAFYSILSNADIQWPTIKLSDGTEARLDQSGYTKWRAAPNRADRQAVFEAFWKTFREYERTFGISLYSQVKTDWFEASVRHYPSSLAAALDGDDIPEAVYRTLIAETNANLPTLHRYFKLRGRMLGISDLRYWDIYPPIVKLNKDFPLAMGKELAIAAEQPLGPEYQAHFAACLNGRYTSWYPQPGKTSGAYMNGSAYDVHPFVLMSYNDDYESVSTISHEWGHGMHSLLANHAQPYPTAQYSTFIAEIASTLNETLLLEHMLKVANYRRGKALLSGLGARKSPRHLLPAGHVRGV